MHVLPGLLTRLWHVGCVRAACSGQLVAVLLGVLPVRELLASS